MYLNVWQIVDVVRPASLDHLREAAEKAVSPVQTGTKTDTGHLEAQRISSDNVQQVF
jgi:hypothetical protein